MKLFLMIEVGEQRFNEDGFAIDSVRKLAADRKGQRVATNLWRIFI